MSVRFVSKCIVIQKATKGTAAIWPTSGGIKSGPHGKTQQKYVGLRNGKAIVLDYSKRIHVNVMR